MKKAPGPRIQASPAKIMRMLTKIMQMLAKIIQMRDEDALTEWLRVRPDEID